MMDTFKLPDFEEEIIECLRVNGGPLELAPQLVAIAQAHCLIYELKQWIIFHRGQEWTGAQFETWCMKFLEFRRKLAEAQRDLDKWRRPE